MALPRTRLDGRRRALGLTQGQLAEAVGVSLYTVQRWLSGRHAPQPHHLPRLAQVLKVSLQELDGFLGDESESLPPAELRRDHVLRHPRSVDFAAARDFRDDLEELSARYDTLPSASLLPEAQRQLTRLEATAAQAQRSRLRRELHTLHADATLLMGALVWDASQRSDLHSAGMYYKDAMGTARTLQDRALEGYALLRLAYLELYGARQPLRGFELAKQAARRAGPVSHALAGVAHLHAAEAQAMLGEERACTRALIAADYHLERASDADVHADLLSPSPVGRLTGACYLALGQHHRAQAILSGTAAQLVGRPKSRSIAQGNLAMAYVGAGDVDGAVEALNSALGDLEKSRGGGGMTIAATAVRHLRPWRTHTAVADVTDRMLALLAAPYPRSS
ncbi:helix-turn-helix domain-containing protein [Streptomyces spectabilis]|uniref:helix-turn-helix domain-containing protein n=1 Tax=Streptomyces spectabilis TaxID=68270 RepID=UPI0033E718F1